MWLIGLDDSDHTAAGYYGGFMAGHLIVTPDKDDAQVYFDEDSATRTAEILSLLFATVAFVEAVPDSPLLPRDST